jgi:deoxyribodipyrimidine photo-lyase
MGQYRLHFAVVSTIYSTGSAFSRDLRRRYPHNNFARFSARIASPFIMENVDSRVQLLNAARFRESARYVLYWAQVNRRVASNHGLAHAVELANRARLPVLFYEGLTYDYPHASDRLDAFILEGVPATERQLQRLGIGYVFYHRRKRSDPNDVLYRLAKDAAAVVTDHYPLWPPRFFNPRVASKLDIPYYAVDSSCIVPMSRFEKREYAAYTIRPKINKLLAEYLRPVPPIRIRHKFDGPVRPSSIPHGGSLAAHKRLRQFLKKSLHRYANLSNQPTENATSGLSPYLHFGQISSLEVALAVRNYASEHKLLADKFLEELIVRRELGFNFARFTERPESLDALPDWARKTLQKHARDRRNPIYSREQLEAAKTHDPLWNAAQKELLLIGKIHGYYRMYWGKKIIEWSRTPAEALATAIYLNDHYALDGRDPNSYSNILWCFGLHDRPWGERPIFGQVRYMSLDGMRRKTDVDAYIRSIEYLE